MNLNINAIPIPLCILESRVISRVNNKFVEFFNLTDPVQILGKNISSVIKHTDKLELFGQHEINGSNEFIFESNCILCESRKTHLEITCTRMSESERNSLIATFKDISPLKIISEKLVNFERIVNLSANPIAIVDVDGKFLFFNPAFNRVLGYPDRELKNKKIHDLIYHEDIPGTFEYIQKCIAEQSPLLEFENRYVKKDGGIVWFSWMTQPIYDEGISISVAHDITKLKATEKKLLKAKEEAENSNQFKSVFLANISHEIRTPLNGIIGFSNMLERPNLTDEQRINYAKIINTGSIRLLTLLNDVIDISKIESGNISINKKVFDLQALMNELYSFYQPQAQRNSIELLIDLPSDNHIYTLNSDSVKIRQILNNLLSNAIKFTFKGFVKFGVTIQTGQLEFFVQDTGIGIPEEQQEIIFERFKQSTLQDIEENYGGTGLGLSISKGFVDKMGGKIWLESVPEKGTTFYFTIPL